MRQLHLSHQINVLFEFVCKGSTIFAPHINKSIGGCQGAESSHHDRKPSTGGYPRPTYGIFVAMIVMNWMFVSSGKLAINRTCSPT